MKQAASGHAKQLRGDERLHYASRSRKRRSCMLYCALSNATAPRSARTPRSPSLHFQPSNSTPEHPSNKGAGRETCPSTCTPVELSPNSPGPTSGVPRASRAPRAG
eukprot:705746-Pelagomonas_calceolata.AAC.2